jgi:DNA replication protein DnaC
MENSLTLESKLVICPCKEERMRERKIREISRIPETYQEATIKSFDTNIYKTEENRTYAEEARHAAVQFIKNFDKFRELGKGLYFYSHTKGSGKTRLVCSIANALMSVHNVKVHFTTTADLLDNIRMTFNEHSEFNANELMQMYRTIDVLILDDLGVEKVTPWVVEKFTQILNDRMENKRVTLFTSNVNIERLNFETGKDELRNETERIITRIKKMAIQIQMPEENVRDRLSKEENSALLELLFGDE